MNGSGGHRLFRDQLSETGFSPSINTISYAFSVEEGRLPHG
jgi:hypothetical protein